MRKALKIIGWCGGLLAILLALISTWHWSKRHVYWFTPISGARLTVQGVPNRPLRLYKSAFASFALLPDRTMILIDASNDQKQTYGILGPGPGHLPDTFKGSVVRCESALVTTPLFAVAHVYSDCEKLTPNWDDSRNARFGDHFVEFTNDDGKRTRVEW